MATLSPSPDEFRSRTDDPDGPAPPPPPRRGASDSATSDEISVLLSSSLESPQPDPMLGGSSSWDLARIADRVPKDRPAPADSTAGLDVGVDLTSRDASAMRPRAVEDCDTPVDWPGLILRSYASALTLGMAWLLWTGKASPPPAPMREAPAPRRRPAEPAAEAPIPPEASPVRTTALGKAIVVGELEVTPLLVLRREVTLVRNLGEEALVREHDGCLALTIRLKNVGSSGDVLRPIDAADLSDGTAFSIEAGTGPGIAMFALAPGSGWTIEEQRFPSVAPGEVADVVLLSEPIPDRRLPAAMTWRFRVATDPERIRRAALGVTFGPNDLP